MKQKINHPMADTISMVKNPGPGGINIYADAFSSELAFFRNGEWVTDIIPEFAEYADGVDDEDTRIYAFVPDSKTVDFVNKYMV